MADLKIVNNRIALIDDAENVIYNLPDSSGSSGQPLVTDGVGNLSFSSSITLAETTEILSSISGATGIVIHNLNNSAIFYHTSASADFTANFTNVPITNDRTISVSLIISQGATARLPTAVQIDGVSQTLNWQGGVAPEGTANKIDIVSFTFIRVSNTWTVIGLVTGYANA